MKGEKIMEKPTVFIDQLAGANPEKVEKEYGRIVVYNDPYHFLGTDGEDVEEQMRSFRSRFLGRGVSIW